jgi:phage protein D
VSLRRPAAELTVDGRRLTLAEAAIAQCAVETSVLGQHDRATIVLGPLSPLLGTAAGVQAELAIGYGDETETVLTGTVDRVGQVPWGTCLEVLSKSAALDRVRVGRAYVQQTVGDIARDLLGQGGVDAGLVDDGATLAVYHLDERRSAWHHLRALASLFAAELSSGGDGSVSLHAPRQGSADHTLRAGAELLGWVAGANGERGKRPSTGPFSAASEQGSDAWSLVHHEPGGSGDHEIVPAIRDQDGASARDDAVGSARQRAKGFARAGITGNAALRAGDLVELEGLDRAAGTYRVLCVTHRIDDGGFVSALTLEAAA